MVGHTKSRTSAEDERFRKLKWMGCIACGPYGSMAEIHHLLSGNKRRGHMFTIPLCSWHHRGVSLSGLTAKTMTSMYGPSLARESKAFHARYGTDDELLEKTNKLLQALLLKEGHIA